MMLIENKVKKTLRAGGTVIGCQVAEVRSPNIALLYGTAGFDFIFIDMEHGAFDLETVGDFITASKAADIVPVVRVPALEEHFLSRPLDLGACAIMVPHVQKREQIQKVIQATKFRPLGERGLAPLRAHTGFGKVNVTQFIKEANENTMVIIMVEDDEAIQRIDDLISVEGVDVVFMGTMDLSYNLGIPGEVRHPEIMKRITKVIEACDKRGVAFGMPINNPNWYQKGIRFLFAASDIDLIVSGGAKVISDYEEVITRENEGEK
jgi:2-keto-3-deoxy-L-rhamnonate aldolase RhmA